MSAPLYHSFDPVTRRATRVITDSETGLPLIITTHDGHAIADSAKRLASNFDKHIHPKSGVTHVARLPYPVWNRLNRIGITRDRAAFRVWLNSREARAFRTDDARRL